MNYKTPQLIVALDVDTLEETRTLVNALSPAVDIFKVGSQLFTACGPAAVRFILSRGKKVFLDLKYHDIPNTVGNAVKTAVGLASAVSFQNEKQSLFMLTVHTVGGKDMLQAAVKAAREKAPEMNLNKPLVVGITVLTSEERNKNTLNLVVERAVLAQEAGLDGIVASVEEAKMIRQKFGEDFVIVTPGIRPQGQEAGDQKRIATPAQAVLNGSNFLVVGRPIVASKGPLEVAQKILEEINLAI